MPELHRPRVLSNSMTREQNPLPPVVLIHGWGCDSQIWQLLTAEFAKRNRNVITLDIPGFGEAGDIDCDGIDQVIEYLAQRLPEQCFLVGWSLGAMLAVRLAERQPHKVLSLVSIAANARFAACDAWEMACPASTFEQFSENFNNHPAATIQRFSLLQAKGDRKRKSVTSALQQAARAFSGEPQQAQRWQRALGWLDDIDNRNILPQLVNPHLTLLGAGDELVPSEVGEILKEKRMTDELVVIPDVSHAPHVSQPEQVADLITDFCTRAWSQYARDKRAVARAFNQAAASYDSAAKLQHKVAKTLVAMRRDYAGVICDLGSGTGFCTQMIKSDANTVLCLDIAEGMLKTGRKTNLQNPVVLADFEQLPFASKSLDGVISSMSLQWSSDIRLSALELKRALAPGGWLLFSTLGPDTLKELRVAWRAADRYTHVNRFDSIATTARALKDVGFKVLSQRTESHTLYYPSVRDLMRDLKTIGAHNVNSGQRPGLTPRQSLVNLSQAYDDFRDEYGLPATYEVHYFLAQVGE